MNIGELTNAAWDELSEGERSVCRFVLAQGPNCASLGIEDVARGASVSKSMVVRFAKRLGLSGYGELRARLSMAERSAATSLNDLLYGLGGTYFKVIDEMATRDLSPVFEALDTANRVYVHGSGSAQGRIASEMARIFLPILSMVQTQGHDMAPTVAGIAVPGDLVFLISLTGESKSIVGAARTLKQKGVATISVTRSSSNTLASLCDYCLYIQTYRMGYRGAPAIESNTSSYILIEYLYLAYRKYRYQIQRS